MIARVRKRCPYCGKVKPVANFYRCSHTSDGLQGKCKDCQKCAGLAHRVEGDQCSECGLGGIQ